jgi:hypothetical protein
MGGTMLVLIAALIIVVGAFALAAINEYVDNLPLAVALEIILLAHPASGEEGGKH